MVNLARRSVVVILVLLLTCTALLGVASFSQYPALADVTIDGAAIFEVHCVGCHIHGGNIIRRGKTLKLPALKRNGMDSVAAIAELVTNGKANMSAYGDRLTQEEIQAVAAYVWQQAEQGW
jgi:cytochrome c6